MTLSFALGGVVSALSASPDGSHALVAGRDVLAVLAVGTDAVTESQNLRACARFVSGPASARGLLTSPQTLPHQHLASNDTKWAPSYAPTTAATAAASGAVVLWAVGRSDAVDRMLLGHPRAVNRISFHPSEPLLLSASQDGSIRLWDLRTPSQARLVLDGRAESVRDVQFAPSGRELAAAFENGTVQRWDLRAPAQHERRWSAHNGLALAVAWHPDGRLLASGGRDRAIKIWDTRADAHIRRPVHAVQTIAPVARLAWRPSSASGSASSLQIASCALTADARVHVWDAANRPFLPLISLDAHSAVTTAFVWDGPDRIWSCSKDKLFCVQDLADGCRPESLFSASAVSWSATGSLAFVAGSRSQPENAELILNAQSAASPPAAGISNFASIATSAAQSTLSSLVPQQMLGSNSANAAMNAISRRPNPIKDRSSSQSTHPSHTIPFATSTSSATASTSALASISSQLPSLAPSQPTVQSPSLLTPLPEISYAAVVAGTVSISNALTSPPSSSVAAATKSGTAASGSNPNASGASNHASTHTAASLSLLPIHIRQVAGLVTPSAAPDTAAFTQLAQLYSIDHNNVLLSCAHNAQVAAQFGCHVSAQTWHMVRVLIEPVLFALKQSQESQKRIHVREQSEIVDALAQSQNHESQTLGVPSDAGVIIEGYVASATVSERVDHESSVPQQSSSTTNDKNEPSESTNAKQHPQRNVLDRRYSVAGSASSSQRRDSSATNDTTRALSSSFASGAPSISTGITPGMLPAMLHSPYSPLSSDSDSSDSDASESSIKILRKRVTAPMTKDALRHPALFRARNVAHLANNSVSGGGTVAAIPSIPNTMANVSNGNLLSSTPSNMVSMGSTVAPTSAVAISIAGQSKPPFVGHRSLQPPSMISEYDGIFAGAAASPPRKGIHSMHSSPQRRVAPDQIAAMDVGGSKLSSGLNAENKSASVTPQPNTVSSAQMPIGSINSVAEMTLSTNQDTTNKPYPQQSSSSVDKNAGLNGNALSVTDSGQLQDNRQRNSVADGSTQASADALGGLTMNAGQELTDIPANPTNPFVYAESVGLAWKPDGILHSTISYYAQGDNIQMCVTLILVLQEWLFPASSFDMKRHKLTMRQYESCFWAYIDILKRHRLWTVATSIANASPAILNVKSQVQSSVLMHTTCPKCLKPLSQSMSMPGWFCEKCRPSLLDGCSLCRLPVKGLYTMNPGCGHGGHVGCMQEWYSQSSECPTCCDIYL